MEFHEILAIAQKRQLKKDKEVREIDQLAKQRRLERFNELEQARKASIREKPSLETQQPSIQKEKHQNHEKDKEVREIDQLAKQRRLERFNELEQARKASIREKLSLETQQPSIQKEKHQNHENPKLIREKREALSSQSKTSSEPNKVQRSNSATSGKSALSIERKSSTDSSDTKKKSKIPPSPPSISNSNKPKTPKLSFAELLEIAKKNEDVLNVKKQKFEDLIPCSHDSIYRKLDSRVNKPEKGPSDTKTIHRPSTEITPIGHSHDPQKQKVSSLREPGKPLNNPRDIDATKASNTITNGDCSSKLKGNLLKGCNTKNQLPITTAKPLEAKGIIASRKPADHNALTDVKKAKFNLDQPAPLQKSSLTPSRSGTQPHGSAIAVQLQAKAMPTTLPAEFSEVKKLSKNKIPLSKDKNSLSHQTKQLSATNDNKIKKKRLSSPPVYKLNKDNKLKGVPEQSSRQISRIETPSDTRKSDPPVCRGRGIAAQLGINIGLTEKRMDESEYECSEDDYESDDSFIDDSDVVESKEYARVVRDIHKALRFDPRKYKEVNPWDDLRSMEANYRDIEKEEKRSARLAAIEDAIELERDLQRKKAKLASRTVV